VAGPGRAGAATAAAAARHRVAAAYHAPVPEDHVLSAPDLRRVLHAGSRLPAGRPPACPLRPEPRKA